MFLDKLLEAISKCRLFDVNVHVHHPSIGGTHVNAETIRIGDETVHADQSKNKLVSIEGPLPLGISDPEMGPPRPQIDHVILEGLPGSASERVCFLDNGKKLFTRSDIAEREIQFLQQMREHEKIVQSIRPLLGKERVSDLGALIVAATLVRIEDRADPDPSVYAHFHDQLCERYGRRGTMVYNLLRAGILQKEIIPSLLAAPTDYVEALEKWDSYLMKGYPSAWFVQSHSTEKQFSVELDWRFAEKVRLVRVFSRTEKRNAKAKATCRKYAEGHGLRYRTERYQLGCTPAMVVRLFV